MLQRSTSIRYLGLLALLVQMPKINGQSTWLRTYDLGPEAALYGSCLTADGGTVLCGALDDTSALLMKVDTSGALLWTRSYATYGAWGALFFDYPYYEGQFRDVVQLPDSELVAVGYAIGQESWPGPAFIMASFTAQGDTLMARSGGNGWAQYFSFVQVLDNGTLLAGGYSGSGGSPPATLFRFDPDTFNVLDRGRWSDAQFGLRFTSGLETTDGTLVLAGQSTYGGIVVRTDPDMNEQWHVNLSVPGTWLAIARVVEAPDGSLWLSAGPGEPSNEPYPFVLVHIAANGTVLGSWTIDLSDRANLIVDMAVKSTGELLLTGYSVITEWGALPEPFGWIMQFDVDGNLQWARRLGLDGEDVRISSFELLPDETAMRLSGDHNGKLMLVQLDANGQLDNCSLAPLDAIQETVAVGYDSPWSYYDLPWDEWYYHRAVPSAVAPVEADPCYGMGLTTLHATGLAIAPNPLGQYACITSDAILDASDRIELRDQQGRLLHDLHGNGTYEVCLQRGDLRAGLYVVHVLRNGEPAAAVKLVVE